MTTFEILTNADASCGNILVTDNSIYDPDTRNDYGIALFWSIDEFATARGSDRTNDTEWTIPSVNNQTFRIITFAAPVWTATTWDTGDISFHSGVFYRANTNISPGAPDSPDVSGDWDAIETDDLLAYNQFLSAGNVFSSGRDTILDCALFNIFRTSCKNYSIVNNSGYTSDMHVYVYDYLGAYIGGYAWDGLNVPIFELTLDEIDVYVVRIYQGTLPAEYVEPTTDPFYEAPIFEFCDMEECLKKMINYILSNCDNPCEDICDEDARNKAIRYRLESNKILALYYPILAGIYTDRMVYSNFLNIGETRMEKITTVGNQIRRLKEIVDRCGVCQDDSIPTQDCNC